jgi:hypothetical protein
LPVCDGDRVSLGEAPKQLDLWDPVSRFCAESLPASSIYGFLYRERDRLFPDELFTDLFAAFCVIPNGPDGGGVVGTFVNRRANWLLRPMIGTGAGGPRWRTRCSQR